LNKKQAESLVSIVLLRLRCFVRRVDTGSEHSWRLRRNLREERKGMHSHAAPLRAGSAAPFLETTQMLPCWQALYISPQKGARDKRSQGHSVKHWSWANPLAESADGGFGMS
jgi:hypothetical protein